MSLAILVPPIDKAIPGRTPGQTSAGNLTLRKLNQTERSKHYFDFVCGQVLATVREALAVAPAVQVARIVVLRDEGYDAYGSPRVACIFATSLERGALAYVRWDGADAREVMRDAARESITNLKPRTGELMPIDLSREPEISTLIAATNLHELMD